MDPQTMINEFPGWLFSLLIALAIWEMTWKVIAMWKAARNNKLSWFVCIAVLNTAGILPIVYLLTQRKNQASL